MSEIKTDVDQYSINVAKGLVMDTVLQADSGHTGGPLSSLDFTYILFKEFLKFDPDDPDWNNRDRFVMSIGHESALLYTMLCFVGWLDVSELKRFRQLGSKTPGHPERGLTPGVEATTGPLGQGVGNAVGMAIAEKILSEKFGPDVVNHYTYVLHGDGDIQEPVAQGAIAIAGHFGLEKLIMFYDSNDAQISGKVSRSDSTDYAQMYKSHGWHVQEIDGHNHDEIRSAIRIAQMEIEKPSIIIGKTIMAKGCANVEGDHNTHGAPLSPDEIAETKKKLNLNPEDFSGGVDSKCFRVLEALGFRIVQKRPKSNQAKVVIKKIAEALVLAENEETVSEEHDWSDVTGVRYNYPNSYVNRIKSGLPFVYYRGVRRKGGKRGQAEYFGSGVIGDIWQDPTQKVDIAKKDRQWFCTVENFERFKTHLYPTRLAVSYLKE